MGCVVFLVSFFWAMHVSSHAVCVCVTCMQVKRREVIRRKMLGKARGKERKARKEVKMIPCPIYCQ